MECRAHGITYRELMVQLLGMYRVLGSTPRTAKTGDKSDDRHTEKKKPPSTSGRIQKQMLQTSAALCRLRKHAALLRRGCVMWAF